MEQFGTITATASVLPEKIITNDDLSNMMDTSDEWISSRTGIRERRCVTDQETSDLCFLVAKKLMKKRNLAPEELDFIIVATMSPDYTTPSVAAQVQGKLGAVKAIAFDISAACSGFVYALSMAEKMIRCGSSKGLVIGGETLSKLIDWSDRTTAVLFGDGAGGVLLEAGPEKKILAEKLSADGKRSNSLTAGYHANKNPFYSEDSEGSYYLKMIGRDIFDFAVRDVAVNIQEITKDVPVDYLLLHQANLRIIEKIARKVKIPQEKFLTNMDKYGNTSAASIPILLDEAVSSGTITLGNQEKIVFTGYGGGLTWGSILIEL
ncbi:MULTISPECIES: beta-ketoacyl-ACP synthase III [unclassified Enterococcus]|uniref:beta-ketoacyl-ACP synthase III n=1 Tax=unclassified Enterococcus TaxID=2608891 RepID=UPI0013ED6711|nr:MULTISPECIES: beta-ketoacyl-ACP synthase III [unclassified Enterococcus]